MRYALSPVRKTRGRPDRMDLTGARWGLPGAEAILKLRALRSNGDWDEYWNYHLRRERKRVHTSRNASNRIPQAA
jgi:hypothetical protein